MSAIVSVSGSMADVGNLIFECLLDTSIAVLIVAPMVTGLCCAMAFGVRRLLSERARREDMVAVAKTAGVSRDPTPKIRPEMATEPGDDGKVTLLADHGHGHFLSANSYPPYVGGVLCAVPAEKAAEQSHPRHARTEEYALSLVDGGDPDGR